MKVPFFSNKRDIEEHGDEYRQAISDVIAGGNFVLGTAVERFEEKFARYCGVRFCVSVGNGLEALSIALKAYGVKPGDEVIVPAHTFVASWLAISQTGAFPVPVDVDARTFNIDVVKIRAAITEKTKAVIAVHLYGLPADMDALRMICAEAGLLLLEDAAQAHGALLSGVRTGALGDAAAFSFYPTKNLGAFGDAGAICTNDETLANKARCFRNYGSIKKYEHEDVGVNSRLDDIQAAVLEVKLERLDALNTARRVIADRYKKKLLGTGLLSLPTAHSNAEHVYHLFVIQSEARDHLQAELAKGGITTLVHYPVPPHKQNAYRNFSTHSFPVTESIARNALSLPIFPELTLDEVDFVCDEIIRHL